MLAITNAANVRLAKPFNVPKAMPMERCFVGVTRICSATRIAEKSPTPVHNSQLCCGSIHAKATSAATLTQWSAILIYNDVATETFDGMECRPRLRSNSASCKA